MFYFVITLALAYLLYFIFIINKYDKNGKLKNKKSGLKNKLFNWLKIPLKEKDEAKLPAEVEVFIIKFKVDLKKVNFKKMLHLIGFVCSLDIAIIVSVVASISLSNVYAMLGIGALLVFPVILISFWLLGLYYKKKGLTKNV